MFILTLILYHLFDKPGNANGEQFTLTAGKYKVDCYGGKGGQSYTYKAFKGASIDKNGGNGAHVSGIMTIKGNGTIFYAFVGGNGASDKNGPSEGGFNGGGKSGKATGSTYGAGGGGGSTDLRIHNTDINNRIIVAAGGSGAVTGHNGCNGGGLKGRYYNNNQKKCIDSDSTTQHSGNALLNGGNGKDHGSAPSSGGGGGYWGGVSKSGSILTQTYKSVSESGSSYISGCEGCDTPKEIVFDDPQFDLDTYAGNGYLEVTDIYVCSKNCYTCTENEKCDECVTGFFLYNNQCLTECPQYTTAIGGKCEDCQSPCKTCSLTTTHCESCTDGYLFYNNQCLRECPLYTTAIDGRCEDCQSPCKTCSSETTHCESCIDNLFLYKNQCIDECPPETLIIDQTCQDCQSPCKTCSSSITHCETCKDGFFFFNNSCYSDCSELNDPV